MACGRIACGRGACGRSAVGGEALFLTPPAGEIVIAPGSGVRPAVDLAPAAESVAIAGAPPQALLTSSASGRVAFQGSSASIVVSLAPDSGRLAAATVAPQALLSSSASGRTAFQSPQIAARVSVAARSATVAIGPRPVRASVDASIGSSNLVLKPSINVAAGIPGNFAAETVAVRGGTLHAVITAVPGERYLLLSDRACGRGACGRSPTLILTFQPSRTVAVDVGVVVPNVTVRPKTSEMARRAATVGSSATVVPSPEVIAIAAGRFPVRPRVALFTFD